eukprot:PhF_6_TR41668/c0_g1_i3/m.63172
MEDALRAMKECVNAARVTAMAKQLLDPFIQEALRSPVNPTDAASYGPLVSKLRAYAEKYDDLRMYIAQASITMVGTISKKIPKRSSEGEPIQDPLLELVLQNIVGVFLGQPLWVHGSSERPVWWCTAAEFGKINLTEIESKFGFGAKSSGGSKTSNNGATTAGGDVSNELYRRGVLTHLWVEVLSLADSLPSKTRRTVLRDLH